MDEFESQSYYASHRTRSFFIPPPAEAVLYILLGLILLLLFNWSNLFTWLGDNYTGSAGNLQAGFNELNNSFSHSFNSVLGGRLGQIVVWSFVGAATYIGLWFVRNLLNSFENDVIVDHYLHPGNYTRLGYWQSALAGKVFFAASGVVLIAYLFFAITVFLPATATLAASATYHFHLLTSPFYISIALLAFSLAVYIFMLIAKAVTHLWGLL